MRNHSYQRFLLLVPFVLACFVCDYSICKAQSGTKTLHLEGNVEDTGGPASTAQMCTGNGADDVVACDGPIINEFPNLSTATAASWTSTSGLNGTGARTIYDPAWVWRPSSPVTLTGSITVSWWASCNACTTANAAGAATWNIKLFTDITTTPQAPAFTMLVTATPRTPNVPELLTVTIPLTKPISVTDTLELMIDPQSAASQATTKIYYDSTITCPGAVPTVPITPCDSTLKINTLTTAAQSSIHGRITNSAGRGLSNINVFLNSTRSLQQFTTRTDLRGNYIIENVPSGTDYIIYVRRKGYRFSPDSQFLNFNGDQNDVDFVGNLR